MKQVLFLAALFLMTACQDSSAPNIDLSTSTRAALAENQTADQDLLEEALAALDMSTDNKAYFFSQNFDDGLKSSNLGNGKYVTYLKVTFRLTDKALYQQEILEARQVCIREMMHTHYAYSKEEVINELTKILGGSTLLATEKQQINIFLEHIITGVYQDTAIQFSCSNPTACLS